MSVWSRFEKFIYYEPNTGCWLWGGCCHPMGHGRFRVGGETIWAHRFSFEMHNPPIPDGMHVCHKCDVPNCVNPDHMFLGSHQDNMNDMHEKKRHAHGERHGLAKLTESDVLDILNDSRSQQQIAKDYGIWQTAVSHIKTGRRWRHVYEQWSNAA